MRAVSLRVQNLRNIAQAVFAPDPALTVIAGPNGQGKTNLLECVWLLTGSKSFRGAKDVELVREGEAFGRLEALVENTEGEKEIELVVGTPESGRRGRSAKVNGVAYGRATSIAGVFTAVVFEPGHLSLVKSGPEGRRRFLDAALCQLYPGYIGTLRRYQRALTQKNALLKKYSYTPDADSLLDAFDAELAAAGCEITRRRQAYLAATGPMAEEFYKELSSAAEILRVVYQPCCAPEAYAERMHRARQTDLRAGFCTVGPHREDFSTTLDGRDARHFGSQGQQRSIVLALKLAEAKQAHTVTGEHPVMLLDDVLSELDAGRQEYLLARMGEKQCIVTTCDSTAFGRTAGLVVRVEGGRILA